MLTKIIYKNFRSNLKNYILFFLSNIVAIMELFVFYGIRSIIKSSITDKVTAEALKTDFQIAVGIIAVITLMLSYCDRIILLKDGKILEELKKGSNRETFYQTILSKMAEL